MCHNSGIQSAHIERYIEYGMPQKIIKTVIYTLKRRAADQQSKVSEDINACPNCMDTTAVVTNVASANNSTTGAISTKDATNPTNADETSSSAAAAAVVAVDFEKKKDEQQEQQQEEQKEIASKKNVLEIPRMCGRFRQLQSNAIKAGHPNGRINGNHKNVNGQNVPIHEDVLALSTHLTKQFAWRLHCVLHRIQQSKLYTVLTRTTQPAHVVAICILAFVLLTIGPNLFEGKNVGPDAKAIENAATNKNTLAVIAYLGAFATHFGAQIWMTFVSGLSLYFSLPRHTFGQCQQILFPKYFALNAILSIGMLILFTKYFLINWNISALIQVMALGLSAIIEVTVRLYLAPPMLRLMHEKYKIEGAVGSGKEVGSLEQGDLVQCPHYQRVHKAFRRIHMTIAIGNIVVLLATCLHLYFLASKIQIAV